MRLSKRTAEHYRGVADRYEAETGQTHYDLACAVQWAMAHGELELSPADVREIHVARMSEAQRADKTKDSQGRNVRQRHCCQVTVAVPGEEGLQQRTLWAHVDRATDEFLIEALVQRHEHIRGDVEALRADLDYINARLVAHGRPPLQMNFNYT